MKNLLYSLLRKSERYFKTDMIYVAKGGSWLSVGQFVSSIMALVLSIAFARLVEKEVYGEYKYILSLASLLGIFTLSGMSTAIAQATAAGHSGTIISAFKITLRFNFILVPITIAMATYHHFISGNPSLTLASLLIGATSPLISSFTIFGGLLLGKKDFKGSVLANSLIGIIPPVLVMATMLVFPTPLILATTYFSTLTLVTAYLYFTSVRKYAEKEARTDWNAIRYGKHTSAMNIFGIIASQIDKVIVFHYLGPTQLAIYAFALAIPDQIKGMIKNLNSLMLPRFAERDRTILLPSLWKKMLLLGGGISCIALAYIGSAPIIFNLLFPEYTESVFYSQLIALSLITFAANVPATAMQAQLEKKILYTFNISWAIIQIILVMTLTPPYGLFGAIMAIIVGRVYFLFFWIVVTLLISQGNETKK